MTQFNNATFSVGGRHCDGCSQRDVWLEQKDEEIKRAESYARIHADYSRETRLVTASECLEMVFGTIDDTRERIVARYKL